MKKLALILAVTSIAMTFATSASALDAYKDRRGLFVGLNLGGGMGFSGVDEATDITGLDNGQPGLQLGGEIGGGLSKQFTGALETNWWYRKVRLGERKLNHHHLNIMPAPALLHLRRTARGRRRRLRVRVIRHGAPRS